MRSKTKDIGGWFEDNCSPLFKSGCLKRGRMFYPFPDSRSSRGTVSAQPGEYMLLLAGGAVLLELKASAKHKTFRSCMSSMVRDSQYGWHKKWHLSGSLSLFLFYSDSEQKVEVWDGRTIVQARRDAKPLPKEGYIFSMSVNNGKFDNVVTAVIIAMEHKIFTTSWTDILEGE